MVSAMERAAVPYSLSSLGVRGVEFVNRRTAALQREGSKSVTAEAVEYVRMRKR